MLLNRLQNLWIKNVVLMLPLYEYFTSTHMITIIPARQQASTSHKTTHNIRHNSAIQVCHYHNIKLVRLSNQLHAAVINDHVIVLNVGVIACYLAGCLQEQAIRQLPEIEQKQTSFLGPEFV